MGKIITLCSSAQFYEHVNELADKLESMGYTALVPGNAKLMRASGNYDVSQHKTWYDNPEDFAKKREFMDAHFKEVEKADAVLLVNDEKHGKPGYIGPNGLMEMAVAYYLNKPIYVLNSVGKDNSVYEEVHGMGCVILDGDLNKISL